MALLTFVWGSGTANATIYWGRVVIRNDHYWSNCLYTTGAGVKYDSGCYNVDALWSVFPDQGGHANVEILLFNNLGVSDCLTVAWWGGPSQIQNSRAITDMPCQGTADQEWMMTTARSPDGSVHYITFYNSYTGTCLDGGIGVYAFPVYNGCDPHNNYQVWDVLVG